MSYHLPSGVAWVEDPHRPDTLYVAKVPDGEPLIMQGPAAAIWLAALDDTKPADPRAVSTLVAQWAQADADELYADIEAFLAQLVDSQLLEVR